MNSTRRLAEATKAYPQLKFIALATCAWLLLAGCSNEAAAPAQSEPTPALEAAVVSESVTTTPADVEENNNSSVDTELQPNPELQTEVIIDEDKNPTAGTELQPNPEPQSPVTTTAEPPAPLEQPLRDGLINSRETLNELVRRFETGTQPTLNDTETLLSIANKQWPYPTLATEFAGTEALTNVYDKACSPVATPSEGDILPNLGQHLYARVLAYWFTQDVLYANSARKILLELAGSSGFRKVAGEVKYSAANQCALELSWLLPLVIESALLLEGWDGWTQEDRQALEGWLADTVYPVTAAIARTRKNNWGSAASFASWSIAHYLLETELPLVEVYPADKVLTPVDAVIEHTDQQLAIMGRTWRGDSRCEHFGIQNHGGIPDELRRGSTGCDGMALTETDRALDYQITHVASLVFHAEALSRQGNNTLYNQTLASGVSAVLQTIFFVIDNENGNSFDWKPSSLGVLRLANAQYNSGTLCDQLLKGTFFTEGRYLPYTQLTHPDNCR